MQNRIVIFDTTLRDGEQSPGASLSVYEKVEIARQLERLGVDVIEAGFPISSPAQFDAVERIANAVGVTVAALARAKEADIDAAWKSIKDAQKKRIHTFSSTSDFHIEGKFGDARYGKNLAEKRQTVIKMSEDAVAYARSLCDDVEFSAEDAGRTDIGYLADIVEAAIASGATTINIPDTTGYTLPSEFAEIISQLFKRVKNINDAIISVHCHNDLGLAVANSLSAVRAGARQVECTINGIGERAGNASLEEFVMALKVRHELLQFDTGINTNEIYNSSKLVSGYSGIIVQPNKAVVGENAFAHESGIHQDGMLKNRNTYEIMTPELVGVPQTKIVLGRHSGRHGLKVRLEALGYSASDSELNDIYRRFTKLADKKKEVYDDDLRIMMGDAAREAEDEVVLDFLQISSGSHSIPTATVRIVNNGETVQESATGDGPVDAVFNAVERAMTVNARVESYQVRSVTSGRQAQGEVILRLRDGEHTFIGRGVSTDIIEASARAYISAINNRARANASKSNELYSNVV